MSPIITLLSDFGCKDHYVGVMKGVMLTFNPNLTIIDISHDVSSYNVIEGALRLLHSYHYFPKGTIHVAVVDPGVGSGRKPLLVVGAGYYFVGPDNGIFGLIYEQLADFEVYELTNPGFFLPQLSNTFHGRDIFAPVAAHLSLGVSPSEMGVRLTYYTALSLPSPSMEKSRINGEVIFIDGFGNLVTNVRKDHVEKMLQKFEVTIRVGKSTITHVSQNYQCVAKGELLALIGSLDLLEISIREGNAAEVLEVGAGSTIEVTSSDGRPL